jgi:hypothetical protein
MTAFISKTTSGNGVIAYQDHADNTQFYYVPLVVDTALGGSLTSFKVDYWGVGRSYLVSDGSDIKSMFGAVLSGTANFDITAFQRKKITAQITKEFGVPNPKLSPLRLKNSKFTPVWAETTLTLGAKSDVQVPANFQFGSQFNFLFGTGNSLFANFVANQNSGTTALANPAFGMNVTGLAEFRGEPWKVTVDAELSSFWKEVRKSVSVSGSFGWFSIGKAEYNQLIVELERKAIVKTKFEQGSLDTATFGSQVFEMGKRIAEKVNGIGGGDFFKFEANPDAASATPLISGIGSLWSVSINLSYSERSFKQTFAYHEELEFSGNFEAAVPAAMTLAVVCNTGTKQYFNELGSPEPCVTPKKVDDLQIRLGRELTEKRARLDQAWKALLSGAITEATYIRLEAYIRETSFTEGGTIKALTVAKELGHQTYIEHLFSGMNLIESGGEEDSIASALAEQPNVEKDGVAEGSDEAVPIDEKPISKTPE